MLGLFRLAVVMNKSWKNGIVEWVVGDRHYMSIVFTWDLPIALEKAKLIKKKVIVGGPAVKLMPDFLVGVAKIEDTTIYPVLEMHNPFATFTTEGCNHKCDHCAVWRIEGPQRDRETFTPKPLLCDNNIFQSGLKWFDHVIDSVKHFPVVDFNQGVDATEFTPHHARKIAEIKKPKLRFAFDHINNENAVVDAINLAHKHGIKDISCYVLFNKKDTPEDARYRCEKLLELGVMPNPMRFQPLDTLVKNSYIDKNWTDMQIKRMRYFWKTNYLKHIPFDEYNPNDFEKLKQQELF